MELYDGQKANRTSGVDGWIFGRLDLSIWVGEFSKALSQWILLTIKGFVLIYWVVIIKTGINKHCTKNNKGTSARSFFPFFSAPSIFPISRILLFQRSDWVQTKHSCCMFMSLAQNSTFFLLLLLLLVWLRSFTLSVRFFFIALCYYIEVKPNQNQFTSFQAEWLKRSAVPERVHSYLPKMGRWWQLESIE